ncbi:MAG: iron-containing alcohol dehydrogenase, partial [Pseudomonadota bacterium]
VDTTGMTQWEARDAALDAIEQLMKAVRLPTTLSDIKADKSLVPQWSLAAHGERRLLGNTPRDLTLQDVEEIFYASF